MLSCSFSLWNKSVLATLTPLIHGAKWRKFLSYHFTLEVPFILNITIFYCMLPTKFIFLFTYSIILCLFLVFAIMNNVAMEPVENPPSTFTAGGTLMIITDIIK
jgi:hypothetical protein